MGYSVSIIAKSEDQAADILDFINANMENIKKASMIDPYDRSSSNELSFGIGEDIAYQPDIGKSKINKLVGFNGTTIPYYVWALFGMLAYKLELNAGRNNPCLFYDSDRIDIVTNENERGEDSFHVDEEFGSPVVKIHQDEDTIGVKIRELILKERKSKLAISEIVKEISSNLDQSGLLNKNRSTNKM